MRSKRGHQKAQTPGRVERGAEDLAPDRQQPRLGIRGQVAGMRAHEAVERLVDEDAALGGAGIGVERVERPQLQDVPRIDARRDRASRSRSR